MTLTYTFHQLTNAHLVSADVVVAFEGRDPARELTLRAPGWAGRRSAGGRATVLRVMIDSNWRDEQVRALRARLAKLHQATAAK